jgi:hypothetical protein
MYKYQSIIRLFDFRDMFSGRRMYWYVHFVTDDSRSLRDFRRSDDASHNTVLYQREHVVIECTRCTCQFPVARVNLLCLQCTWLLDLNVVTFERVTLLYTVTELQDYCRHGIIIMNDDARYRTFDCGVF